MPQEVDGFFKRLTLQSIIRRLFQMLDSARRGAAALEVYGQLRRPLTQRVRMRSHFELGDSTVQPRTPRFRKPIVQHALVQVVEKGICAANRFFDEDIATSQTCAMVLDVIYAAIQTRG